MLLGSFCRMWIQPRYFVAGDLNGDGAGVAGLTELSFELEPGRRGTGGGARLARDVLSIVPQASLSWQLWHQATQRASRALLAAGFKPLGSLQLFRRAGSNPGTLADDLAPVPAVSD